MEFLSKLKNVFVKSVDDSSPVGKVNTTDLAKVARTAILLGLATGASNILTNLKPEMFGEYSSLAAVGLAIAGDFVMRFLRNNK